MVSSVFYANIVASVISGNTALLSGKRNYFKNISLVNRLLNSLGENTVKLQGQYKNTLTDVRKLKQAPGLCAPL